MRIRPLIVTTAILSSLLGAGAAYLALTVPNDLKADSMLKSARKNLENGERGPARAKLSNIVQQYPRTDAAAAATVALVQLGEQERKELEVQIAALRKDYSKQTEMISGVQESVEGIRNAPPKVIVQQAPTPPPAKAPVVKKKVPTRKRTRR